MMDKEIEELVKRSGVTAVVYDLTEERREELVKIAEEVITLLYQRVKHPIEAAFIVQMLLETLQDVIGGKIVTSEDVVKH